MLAAGRDPTQVGAIIAPGRDAENGVGTAEHGSEWPCFWRLSGSAIKGDEWIEVVIKRGNVVLGKGGGRKGKKQVQGTSPF